jgi:hypothetical protein
MTKEKTSGSGKATLVVKRRLLSPADSDDSYAGCILKGRVSY